MRRRGSAGLLVAAVLVSGCVAGPSGSTSSLSTTSVPTALESTAGSAGPAGVALSGRLTIFAAASLKRSFDELSSRFSQDNPGLTVDAITYDGSSVLATQLIGGAQADVFASADTKNMDKVRDAGLLAAMPTEFATNSLQIAVAPGNPRGITSLGSLLDPKLAVVLCDPQQPCGAAAQKALAAANLTIKPVSEEQSVSAVVTKIADQEADAGLVYRTDVLANPGKIQGVDFGQAAEAVNHYPIAILKDGQNAAAAAAFLALVTSPAGQQVLRTAGFGPPAAS